MLGKDDEYGDFPLKHHLAGRVHDGDGRLIALADGTFTLIDAP